MFWCPEGAAPTEAKPAEPWEDLREIKGQWALCKRVLNQIHTDTNVNLKTNTVQNQPEKQIGKFLLVLITENLHCLW